MATIYTETKHTLFLLVGKVEAKELQSTYFGSLREWNTE
jgi:hypothetical protein